MVEPRLVTRRADTEMVQVINEATQIYSSKYLFYRSQTPLLSEHFRNKQHLVYRSGDPIRSLIEKIPGIRSSI